MGLALLAGGFVAFVVDGTRSLAGGGLFVTTLASAFQTLAPGGFQTWRAAFLSHLPAFVWDPLLATLLLFPIGGALCGVGALLILLSHKQHAAIGYPPE